MMNWFSKLFNKKKSELTHEKMEWMLGDSYKDIVVYHIDTGAINQKMYNGLCIVGLKDVDSWMPEFKRKWEQNSALQDLRPVMITAKTVRYKAEKTSRYGTDVLGNIIVWDKKKKVYYALGPKWFFVFSCLYSRTASEHCLYGVADYLRFNIGMLEGFARSRVR